MLVDVNSLLIGVYTYHTHHVCDGLVDQAGSLHRTAQRGLDTRDKGKEDPYTSPRRTRLYVPVTTTGCHGPTSDPAGVGAGGRPTLERLAESTAFADGIIRHSAAQSLNHTACQEWLIKAWLKPYRGSVANQRRLHSSFGDTHAAGPKGRVYEGIKGFSNRRCMSE